MCQAPGSAHDPHHSLALSPLPLLFIMLSPLSWAAGRNRVGGVGKLFYFAYRPAAGEYPSPVRAQASSSRASHTRLLHVHPILHAEVAHSVPTEVCARPHPSPSFLLGMTQRYTQRVVPGSQLPRAHRGPPYTLLVPRYDVYWTHKPILGSSALHHRSPATAGRLPCQV